VSEKTSSSRSGALSPSAATGGAVPKLDESDLDLGFTPPPIDELDAEISNYEIKDLFFADQKRILYRAHQPQLQRDVAIKLLPPVGEENQRHYLENFEHEARTMARLSHPNVLRIHDFGTTRAGLPYFVMEYVSGAILELLIKQGQITMEYVFAWVPQLCEGLHYAHEHDVVHGDLRPENILLTSKGDLKIANFGLASLRRRRPRTSSATEATLLARDYLAPESRDAEVAPNRRADLYSLGVVLYEMLTGQIPRGAFPKASSIAGIDQRFDEIIARAMNPDPMERYENALAIRDLIFEIADDSGA